MGLFVLLVLSGVFSCENDSCELNRKIVIKTSATPLMEMENCERQKAIFSCQKRATQEAPFSGVEKKIFDRVFVMDSSFWRIKEN
ncbi:hypothetical protein [Flavobacterium hydrocarbonoxydans]|uniref:hypothetical protein n=1 Tax=Flavobacterium hydrocarbonoxydans TaxID=2683249 RepID=UPI001E487D06|nr:hypothetical protein [Flavobacterium hydrocarbonoxydans]